MLKGMVVNHSHCTPIGHTLGLSLSVVFVTCFILNPPTPIVMTDMFSQRLCHSSSNCRLLLTVPPALPIFSVGVVGPLEARLSALSLPQTPAYPGQQVLKVSVGLRSPHMVATHAITTHTFAAWTVS